MRNRFLKTFLFLLSSFISLVLCETALRVANDDQFYIWPPNLKQYFLPDASIFPGIKDTSLFRINSLGFRGEEYGDSGEVNIVTIGGSTTECLYLDQKKTWPALLETYLNQNGGKKWRVFNGGRSGLNSQHHVAEIRRLLEHDQWIDLIIVLAGINDLQRALSLGDDYKKEDDRAIYDEAFLVSPLNDRLPLYKRSYIFMGLSKLKRAMLSYNLGEDPEGHAYRQWRYNRAHAREIVEATPALEQPLTDFRNSAASMIDAARSRHKRIIFLTQPVAWSDTMPPPLSALCWFGWIGKNQSENTGRYYSFPQLRSAIDKYNTEIRTISRDNGVECIDLAETLERDTTTFYDDCHFNEHGAAKTARIISKYLLQP
jgi:lysophospholipase L1-like esterase